MDIEREGAKEIERKCICRKRFHKRDEDSLESIMQQENKQAREQIKPAKNMNRQEGTFSFPIKKLAGDKDCGRRSGIFWLLLDMERAVYNGLNCNILYVYCIVNYQVQYNCKL